MFAIVSHETATTVTVLAKDFKNLHEVVQISARKVVTERPSFVTQPSLWRSRIAVARPLRRSGVRRFVLQAPGN